LKLDEAIRIALVNSPRIQQVLSQLDIAREEVEIAAAPKRLFVNIRAGVERIQPAQTPSVQATLSGIEGDFQTNPSFAYNSLEGTIILKKTIFDGGLVAAQIAASRFGAKSTQYEALFDWRMLYLEIETAYIDVLRAQEQIENAKASLELARMNLTTAEKRFAVGQVPRGDIVFAQVPLAQAELELQRSQFARQSAVERLLQLMGLPQDTKIELSPLPPASDFKQSLEEDIASAFERRYDLKAVESEVSRSELALKAARKEDDPRIAVGASINPAGFDGQQLAPGGYRVGVQLEWPLLSGNVVAHQIKAAQAELEMRGATLEVKRQEIEREVREAHREVLLAEIARDSSSLQVEQARESLRIAQGQYRAGLAGFTVVNEQQRELVRTQGQHTIARYSYLISRAKLSQAIGADIIADITTEYPPQAQD